MHRFPRSPIIVPVDYSEASLRAVESAITLVEKPSDLTVVYVIPDMDMIVPGHRWGATLTVEEKQADGLKRMNEWLEENQIAGVQHRILFGDAGMEVAAYAKEIDARLIVLPSHGRHGLKRLLLGSVSERIIRHCECSVLVLRHDDEAADELTSSTWLPRKRVVVPIDFSESSSIAVWTALDMVDSRTDVDVINVVPHLDPVYAEMYLPDPEDDADRRANRQEYLERYLSENDLDIVRAHAIIGDPGTAIAKYAQDHHADLIVIPSHGFHGVRRLVLGSVAERVLRHAHCAVLVVRRLDAK